VAKILQPFHGWRRLLDFPNAFCQAPEGNSGSLDLSSGRRNHTGLLVSEYEKLLRNCTHPGMAGAGSAVGSKGKVSDILTEGRAPRKFCTSLCDDKR